MWKEFDIPTDEPGLWDIGTLKIWYKHVFSELWISHAYKGESDVAGKTDPELPADDSWSRWALRKVYDKVRFKPAFPDRPVVVKPEYPFKIAQGARVRIYVRVPIWTRIEVGTNRLVEVVGIPTVILSNTWFGSVTEGELCYWISTSARLRIEEDRSRPYLAICPVQIINESEQDLAVEKLCLRGAGLSLFDHDGQLWSDETVAKYKGSNQVTEIQATGRVPIEVDKARRIAGPVEPYKKGIRALTFSTIKELPGMGFLSK